MCVGGGKGGGCQQCPDNCVGTVCGEWTPVPLNPESYRVIVAAVAGMDGYV